MDTQELMEQISYGREKATLVFNGGYTSGHSKKQLYAILKTYCDKDNKKCTPTMKSAYMGKIRELEKEWYR